MMATARGTRPESVRPRGRCIAPRPVAVLDVETRHQRS